MRYRSRKKHSKPHVWVTEVRVRDKNVTRALRELLELVKKYEEVP